MIQQELPKIVKLAKSIEHDTSICVKCGLCLEHCPTYLRTHDENESPRGRIALLQAMANESIEVTDSLKTHIDQCLTCRACETACPAYVPYGHLIDAGRTYIHAKKESLKPSFISRMMDWLIQKPKRIKRFHRALWILQITGLRPLGQALGIPYLFGISHLDRMLGKISKPQTLQEFYPARSKQQHGNIGLFVGCMHSWADQKPLFDSINLLTQLGFNVYIPQNQQCCGAMARHDGMVTTALKFGQKNIQVFKDIEELEYITYLPSGCGAELKNYARLFAHAKIGTHSNMFSKKVIDIFSLIQKTNCLENAQFSGFAKRKTVYVHTPCSVKHHLKQPDRSIALLTRIPNLNVVPFATKTCCGAAGSHMIKHPDIASDYLSPYFYELKGLDIDYIASSNVGCALHFKQGLKHYSKKAAIVHPVSLLAAAITAKNKG